MSIYVFWYNAFLLWCVNIQLHTFGCECLAKTSITFKCMIMICTAPCICWSNMLLWLMLKTVSRPRTEIHSWGVIVLLYFSTEYFFLHKVCVGVVVCECMASFVKVNVWSSASPCLIANKTSRWCTSFLMWFVVVTWMLNRNCTLVHVCIFLGFLQIPFEILQHFGPLSQLYFLKTYSTPSEAKSGAWHYELNKKIGCDSLFYIINTKRQFSQHSVSNSQGLYIIAWLKVCCCLYSTFQILTTQRLGRATHWLCREGMDISSPCFLKLWVSIRKWSQANHCYSRSPLDESSSVHFAWAWVQINKQICRGVYGQFSHVVLCLPDCLVSSAF